MKNLQLFHCIKLMEFAIAYAEVQSIDELLKNWPERPNVNATVFTSAGISFLEAAFSSVSELGHRIVGILQNVYKHYRNEGHIIYETSSQRVSKDEDVFKRAFRLISSPGRSEHSQELTGMRSMLKLDGTQA